MSENLICNFCLYIPTSGTMIFLAVTIKWLISAPMRFNTLDKIFVLINLISPIVLFSAKYRFASSIDRDMIRRLLYPEFHHIVH